MIGEIDDRTPLRDFLDSRGYCIVLYDTFAFTLGLLLDDRKTWLWVVVCFHSVPSFSVIRLSTEGRARRVLGHAHPCNPSKGTYYFYSFTSFTQGAKRLAISQIYIYIYITCNTSRAGSLIWHFRATGISLRLTIDFGQLFFLLHFRLGFLARARLESRLSQRRGTEVLTNISFRNGKFSGDTSTKRCLIMKTPLH